MNPRHVHMVALSVALASVVAAATLQAAPAFEDLPHLNGAWSAAKILGKSVHGADGLEVGEVEDLIVASDAKIVTALVSVGGLLGVGTKLVAVPYVDLRVADGETLAIPLTRAETEAAPAYSGLSVDAARVAPPDAADRRAAEAEASRSFAGQDPRVAEGIAENKKAYEEETEQSDGDHE